jgi:hypothetical protein
MFGFFLLGGSSAYRVFEFEKKNDENHFSITSNIAVQRNRLLFQ